MNLSNAKTKILVTGGTGRLAQSIVRGSGWDNDTTVTLYSRTETTNCAAISRLFEDETIDSRCVIMHLAWSCLPAGAEQYPSNYVTEDLPLLTKLLHKVTAIRESKRPHFVFFSSGGAVYGNANLRPSLEQDECRPIGNYGRSKLSAENAIKDHAKESGLAYTILRISNPYGFSVPSGSSQGIIPHAIRAAYFGGTLPIWGEGNAQKDYLHIEDLREALYRVTKFRPHGVYNLATGVSHKLSEVLSEVESQTGRRINRHHEPAHPWDVMYSQLDCTKISRAINWTPRISLSRGIKLSVDEWCNQLSKV
jgi:UDP-glucose 4-epimerase